MHTDLATEETKLNWLFLGFNNGGCLGNLYTETCHTEMSTGLYYLEATAKSISENSKSLKNTRILNDDP